MKKLCVLLSLVIFLMYSFSPMVNVEASSSEDISKTYEMMSYNDAQKVAFTYISFLNDSSGKKWNKNTIINSSKVLFGLNEDVKAYLFNLSTEGVDSGYLIINSLDGQLVEYSYDGTCFLYEAIDSTNQKLNSNSKNKYPKKSGKVYWLGDINYIVGFKSQDSVFEKYYDVTTSKHEEIDKMDAEMLEENLTSSNRPDSGTTHITNPGQYESGYDSAEIYTIPNGKTTSFLV